jgi:hypothetical protein
MVGGGGAEIASSRVCAGGAGDYERRAKPVSEALEPVSGEGNEMKFWIDADVTDEIIICNSCFSAIKAVGQYGRVISLSSGRKRIQR